MTNLIPHPAALRTRSSRYSCLDAVLMLSLALRLHGTDEAIRQTAGRIRDKVPMENRHQMAKIMREDRQGVPRKIVERILEQM